MEFWGQVSGQVVIFDGSLAEKLRFWASKLYFWRKSRRKASFLSFKDSFLKEVSQKSFVWQNHLNHTSVDNHITWTSNHLTSKPLESQINWQPTHLNLDSFESDINWLSNQLNSAHSLPIGSLSLETSATALCGRYVIRIYLLYPSKDVKGSNMFPLWEKGSATWQDVLITASPELASNVFIAAYPKCSKPLADRKRIFHQMAEILKPSPTLSNLNCFDLEECDWSWHVGGGATCNLRLTCCIWLIFPFQSPILGTIGTAGSLKCQGEVLLHHRDSCSNRLWIHGTQTQRVSDYPLVRWFAITNLWEFNCTSSHKVASSASSHNRDDVGSFHRVLFFNV